ncbi:methyltransferase, partial [Actinosynnema sp. NPDC023658]|uniref:methyltransferase n=1 Tax=Actinosynnema sp. NPDC023658 TaxID=3155465 RepID=UPI0033EEFD4D
MYNQLGYELGSWTLTRIEDPDNPLQDSFSLLDMEWDLLPEVFPPYTDPGPGLFASWVPYEEGHRFLEMGCGAGVASVLAAQRGCRRVLALDINPAAVENTRRNAARHGVADRVTALTSDLFDAVDAAEVFDVVFWNSPFIEAPEDRQYGKQIERAVMDPGYGLQRRFFRDAGAHLADGGRIYLGTSDAMGNRDKTLQAAADAGFTGRKHRS